MRIGKLIGAVLMATAASAFATSAMAAQDNMLAKVKESGTLRVCTAAYAPWSVKNPIDNKWEGIVPDIVEEIGKALQVKVEWVDTSWATIVTSIQTGKCDLGGAAIWTAPQRAEVVSFTRPIGGDSMTIFVPNDSTAKSLADVDVAGKNIAVASGSADERVAKALFKKATVKPVVSDQPSPAVMELASGRADAASAALLGTSYFIKKNPNLHVKPIAGLSYNYTPFAFAVPAKEYFFRDYINIVLGNLDDSGKLKTIRDKWASLDSKK
ncbi:MAG: amino acid ABC transporter substrate-binding protein [Rhizobiaceae bacterium]|nr:MAG: amino acid ABC transporter substrate-binding protein [Rhizobiaceae bacterium]